MRIVQLDPCDRAAIVDHLNRGDATVLRLGNPSAATAALTALFGPARRHKYSSTTGFVAIEQASRGGHRTRRPQSTATTQSPHVDGCFLADPPRVVALYCASVAAIGGASQFVSTRAAFAAVAERFTPAEIRPMFAASAYTIQRSDTFLARPVFELVDGRLACYFSSHEFNGATPTLTALPAFNYLKEFVGNVARQTTVDLEAGQGIVFNNTALLHGRQGWSDDQEQKRLIERGWFDPLDVEPGVDLTTAEERDMAERALHPTPRRVSRSSLRALRSSNRIQMRTAALG